MKTSTFGILATVALVLSPVAAFAQETQANIQRASNSAAAIGNGNTIIQNIDQSNFQNQFGADGYFPSTTPQGQVSVQDASNAAAAVGNFNTIVQDVDQSNVQNQYDVNGYFPFYFH
jgi:hypothetical protein